MSMKQRFYRKLMQKTTFQCNIEGATENINSVITALFHSAKMKRRSLCIAKSENVCMRKAASVIALTLSGSRSCELPFLLYQSKLENVAVPLFLNH